MSITSTPSHLHQLLVGHPLPLVHDAAQHHIVARHHADPRREVHMLLGRQVDLLYIYEQIMSNIV